MDDHRVEEALHAAHMYYFQDMTMESLARQMGTSRSTMSRLIGAAKQQGLIEFRLRTCRTG